MERTQYSKVFYDSKLPVADYEKAKTFIADKFGFDRAYIEILRSKEGVVFYPLYKDWSNNFIIFGVKGYTYSCINGELQILSEEG